MHVWVSNARVCVADGGNPGQHKKLLDAIKALYKRTGDARFMIYICSALSRSEVEELLPVRARKHILAFCFLLVAACSFVAASSAACSCLLPPPPPYYASADTHHAHIRTHPAPSTMPYYDKAPPALYAAAMRVCCHT